MQPTKGIFTTKKKKNIMNGDQLQKAMVEIGLGKSWEESSINPKNEENKKDWDDLVVDFQEAEKNGWIIEIPPEIP
jgi:hypothetical protein